MLEERPLGPFDVADILLGAIDARLRLRGLAAGADRDRGAVMSQRIGGWAAILGGLAWLLVLVGSATGSGEGGPLAGILLIAASLLVLFALTGLSAFQARRYPRLVWAAFALPALGGAASTLGVLVHAAIGDEPFLFGLSAWYLWMTGVLTMMAGSALFAAATWRVRALSRAAAAALFVGSVLVVPAVFGMTGLAPIPGELAILAAMLVFAGGWIAIGISALRAGRHMPIGAVVP